MEKYIVKHVILMNYQGSCTY